MTSLLRTTDLPVTEPAAGLRLTEIFYSLQGEAATSGLPTVFIRLTGCPLRCVYCDTVYAFEGGTRHSLEDILAQVSTFKPVSSVCVTGGEPLAQPNCLPLLTLLCDAGFKVSLETSGALHIGLVDKRVSIVMDLKTPSSGEMQRNLPDNIPLLRPKDQLKFVIMNRADFDWACTMLSQWNLAERVGVVWFSPMFNLPETQPAINPASSMCSPALPTLAHDVAEWILTAHLPVRLQLQLHKLLWHDAAGH